MSFPCTRTRMIEPGSDPDAFFERARHALLQAAPERDEDGDIFGDHRIAGLAEDPEFFATAKEAAVLMPVVLRPEGLSLLLTTRSAHLKTHAGQVAFPGGRIDPGETALDAALREAEEEIALPRGVAKPIGFMPAYFSGTGFRVQTVVASIPPDLPLRPNPAEVERIFEIPLDVVLDLARYRRGTIFWRGKERLFYVLDHPEAYIWGLTAGILRLFAERY